MGGSNDLPMPTRRQDLRHASTIPPGLCIRRVPARRAHHQSASRADHATGKRRYRFRHVQFDGRLRRGRQAEAGVSGGRRGHHAKRRILQLRGRSYLFRPPGDRRLHRQCRRTLAARPEERARHIADQREDPHQGAFDCLFGHHRLVLAQPQRVAGSGGRPAGRQHRARAAGAFRRRRSGGRSPRAERAGKSSGAGAVSSMSSSSSSRSPRRSTTSRACAGRSSR